MGSVLVPSGKLGIDLLYSLFHLDALALLLGLFRRKIPHKRSVYPERRSDGSRDGDAGANADLQLTLSFAVPI